MNSLRATIAMLCLFLFLAGCATQDELRHVSRNVDMNIRAVQDSLADLEQSMRDDMTQVRKNQANLSADLITLREVTTYAKL